MAHGVRVIRSRRKDVRVKLPPQEPFDVQELASEAAEALEAYRRAPWRQLTERTRMAELHRAIELLNRIEGIESGRIPCD
jgi:hypothetical protein